MISDAEQTPNNQDSSTLRITLRQLHPEPQQMQSVGSVENVLRGEVPEELKNRRFFAADFRYGFELASPQGIYNLGEAVLFNRTVYSSRTDATRLQRDPLMWGPEFVTSGMFLIPRTATPNCLALYHTLDDPLPLREIYRQIAEAVSGPFAIAGCAELALLHSRSITYSPYEKEAIFENEDKYYTEPPVNEPDCNVAIVGVASDFSLPEQEAINTGLRRVLYYNPFNRQQAGAISHTHAATLNKPILDLSKVGPHHVGDVLHVMDDSLVRLLRAEIFLIRHIESIG